MAKINKRIGIFESCFMTVPKYIPFRATLLILAFFLTSGNIYAHKFYISLTEIRYNSESERFEISMRIFPDDLDRVLNSESGIATNLATDLEPPGADSLVKIYLLEHFKLTVNGEPIHLAYLGKEPEADAIWCYIESEPVSNPATIFVYNDILTAEFQDQVNLIQVYSGKWNRGFLLDREKSSDQLTIGK